MRQVLRLSITLPRALQAPETLCTAPQGGCWVVRDLGGRLTWEEMLRHDIHAFSYASPQTDTKHSAAISPADSCCSKHRIMDNRPLGAGL